MTASNYKIENTKTHYFTRSIVESEHIIERYNMSEKIYLIYYNSRGGVLGSKCITDATTSEILAEREFCQKEGLKVLVSKEGPVIGGYIKNINGISVDDFLNFGI